MPNGMGNCDPPKRSAVDNGLCKLTVRDSVVVGISGRGAASEKEVDQIDDVDYVCLLIAIDVCGVRRIRGSTALP